MHLVKKSVLNILQKNGYELFDKKSHNSDIHELLKVREKSVQYIKELINVYNKVIFQSDYIPQDDTNLSLFSNLLGTDIVEAIYILHYLNKTKRLEGDICEFGVAQGRTSVLLANSILDVNKKLWLYDSFEGLPKPTEEDILKDDIFGLGSMEAYEGKMSCPEDMVLQQMKSYSIPHNKFNIIKGFVENTLSNNSPELVCFAYVDFDFYQPIRTTLDHLDKILVKGGVVIVDDYDFFSEGAKKAVEEFMKTQEGNYNLTLPISQNSHFCILEKV